MKKINRFNVCFVIIVVMLLNSCSKTETSKPEPTPTPVPTPMPAPTGTAYATSPSIAYNQSDTINYTFINADSVWINNILMPNASGFYVTGSLTLTKGYVVKVSGKGGKLVPNIEILITVGQDPRVTIITKGYWIKIADSAKMVGSTGTWDHFSLGCDQYFFYPNGDDSIKAGPCNTNGDLKTAYSFTANGMNWHGVNFDWIILTDTKLTIHTISPGLGCGGCTYDFITAYEHK